MKEDPNAINRLKFDDKELPPPLAAIVDKIDPESAQKDKVRMTKNLLRKTQTKLARTVLAHSSAIFTHLLDDYNDNAVAAARTEQAKDDIKYVKKMTETLGFDLSKH